MHNDLFMQYVTDMKNLYISTIGVDADTLRYLLESYYGLSGDNVEDILSTAKDLIDEHLKEIWEQ